MSSTPNSNASPIPTELSRLRRLSLLPEPERKRWIAKYAERRKLSLNEAAAALLDDWTFVGRPKQLAPPGNWMFWMIRAGRGFGKTLSAAQWIKERVTQPFPGEPDEEGLTWRVGLIAPTLGDVRVTMCEGETGLLSILPPELLRGGSRVSAWNRGTCELYLANGTYMKGFSSDVPNRLRGPAHHYVWGEECSSWEDAKAGDAMDTTFSNMKLGLREGEMPQAVLTSTPKANKLTKDIIALPTLVTSVGSSFENRDNLSELWWETVVQPLVGTRTGRQEIEAELLEDVEGALWTLALIESLRLRGEPPPLHRIVVGVDPNASSEQGANSAGIVVAGRGGGGALERHAYVLADKTVRRASPAKWGQAAINAYHEYKADRIVAEKNQGGEMVEFVLKTIDPTVPVKLVSATKGKRTRAEPVAALYEGSKTVVGRVHHVGAFPELEEELTTWTPEAESPDRLDALVWSLSELMLGGSGEVKAHAPKGRIPAVVSRAPARTSIRPRP